MSGISSGIGLISGIDTANLLDQLIAIERRPIGNLQSRVSAIETQRSAFLALSARLLAIQNSILSFSRPTFFRAFNAASTAEKVLTAEADATAAPGTFTFRVRSLVANHAVISRGFADADTTPVGAGTLTIESIRAKVNPSTELDTLNGGSGVQRGVITITDRAGNSADIDLTTAVVLDDVLDAINGNPLINVRARVTGLASGGVTGDRIVLEDLTDEALLSGSERLIVTDQDGATTAADLGIAGSSASGRIDGRDLVRLSNATPLSLLNDGNGMGRLAAGPDLNIATTLGEFSVSFTNVLPTQLDTDLRVLNSGNGVRRGVIRITDRSGQSAEIDLSGARTVRDVIDAINDAGLSVSATVIRAGDDSFFQITDTSDVPDPLPENLVGIEDLPEELLNTPKLIIEDVTGFMAADLGLVGEFDESVQGHDVYRIETIGDVINAINFAPGNNSLVRASISADGNGITIETLAFSDTLTVSETPGSSAARDLGLLGADGVAVFTSRSLIAGLNTVLLQSLDGGRGIDTGQVRLTDRAGGSTTIDFTQAQTLRDVIDLINADAATEFVASVNAAGNGLMLRDLSGGATGQPIIEDLTGSLASQLGIAVAVDPTNPFADGVIDGGNAQRQYFTPRTLLSALNARQGVAAGTFRITDSNGAIHVVVLDDTAATLGDAIDAINRSTPDTIEARINDTGDGIVVIDSAGGTSQLEIEDTEGDRTAADLRLAGTAKPGETVIDGSFEYRVDVTASDTLEEVARKINEAGRGFSASVLNHGGSINPFSLTVTSEVSGRAGELVFGAAGLDLDLTTLTKAQDAVISIGDDTTTRPILVSSSTNTLDDVLEGVRLNLLSVSDEPVTVTVTQDVDSIVASLNGFADAFNGALDTIDRATSFDPDTLESGPLLGDSTVNLIRNRLLRTVMRRFEDADDSVARLFSIGLGLGAGNRLEFDEERFREVYGESPELVEELFTREETGVGAVFTDMLEQLTRSFDGVVARKNDLLSDQQELLNDRIDALSVLLDARRARLEAQFVALESALAGLQGQQAALNSLAQLTL